MTDRLHLEDKLEKWKWCVPGATRDWCRCEFMCTQTMANSHEKSGSGRTAKAATQGFAKSASGASL